MEETAARGLGLYAGLDEVGVGDAKSAAIRSVLAVSMLGMMTTNSRILVHVPCSPRGYSKPLVSTHRYHSVAIRLHNSTSGHSSSNASSVVAQMHYVLLRCWASPTVQHALTTPVVSVGGRRPDESGVTP